MLESPKKEIKKQLKVNFPRGINHIHIYTFIYLKLFIPKVAKHICGILRSAGARIIDAGFRELELLRHLSKAEISTFIQNKSALN